MRLDPPIPANTHGNFLGLCQRPVRRPLRMRPPKSSVLRHRQPIESPQQSLRAGVSCYVNAGASLAPVSAAVMTFTATFMARWSDAVHPRALQRDRLARLAHDRDAHKVSIPNHATRRTGRPYSCAMTTLRSDCLPLVP